MNKLELLAPAKNKEIGIAAINCGADAVYIAAEHFGAREAASNPLSEIRELCSYAHMFHAKIFVVVNTILYDNEIENAAKLIWDVYNAGADAIIVQDLGLLQLNLPPIPLYASTQTDIRDKGKATMLEKLGFSRLILARELSLYQIKEISSSVKAEIETFVHGALCVSYSGQCYLSQRIVGRSANRGVCAQACRNNYDLVDSTGNYIVKNSHLLSLKDFNLSQRIPDLVKSGVTSFKIEGRLKNESFVRNTVLLYNNKINELIAQDKKYSRASLGFVDTKIVPQAELTFNRGFTQLFIDGKRGDWKSLDSAKHLGEYIGTVTSCKLNRQGYMSFTYKSQKEIVNGDGLCIVNSNGSVTGLRANSCDKSLQTVSTTEKVSVKTGSKIYRNYNFVFEKELEKKQEKRYIPIELSFVSKGQTPEIRVESAELDSNMKPVVSFCFPINYPYQKADNIEASKNNIQKQFSKNSLHFSFSFKNFEGDINELPFYPISVLNSIRNNIADMVVNTLEAKRIEYRKIEEKEEIARRKDRDRFIETAASNNNGGTGPKDMFLQKKGDRNWSSYLLNSANQQSKQLYRMLDISENASAYEIAPVKDAVLMRTKYCIKYQLGLCSKNPKEPAFSKKYKEPFYLCNNNKKIRLVFDCAKCEMMLIG